MNGTNNKSKRLRLETSKEDFLSNMIFESNEERERCLNYLDLKGVAYHTVLANYIGFNKQGKIEYKKVKNLYIYDKRIRNILYKYLSALEEGIRGFICNRYNTKEKIKKLSNRLYQNVMNESSLNKELENLGFNDLLNLTKKLSNDDTRTLFNNNNELEINLNAVRRLRNIVSHHRMLFVCEEYGQCIIGDTPSKTLIDNCRNLMKLLNPFYKEFFVEDINEAILDDDDSLFTGTIPSKAILKL
jgi:hypothetical protein